jgi:glutamyl-tRNA reductase
MEEVAEVLKEEKTRKLFIDLAVPCDIDKGILELEGLELIDIDYFEQASRENNRLKQQELSKAEEILDVCVDETLKEIYFRKFYGSLEQLTNRVKEQGFQQVLYRLKEGLDSQQFKAVLDLLVEEI